MIVDYSVIGKGKMFQISVSNILSNKITLNSDYYNISIHSNDLNLKIYIPSNKYKLFDSGKVSANCFSLKKNRTSKMFDLRIKFPLNIVLKNTKKGYFNIKYNSKRGIKAYGNLNFNMDKIINDSERLMSVSEKKEENKRKRDSLKKEQKKQKMKKYKEMVEKLNQYEERNKKITKKAIGPNNQVDSDDLRRKHISLRSPFSTRRCENCVHFIGVKCSIHNTVVTKNHGCANYKKYKVFFGGGFSPK